MSRLASRIPLVFAAVLTTVALAGDDPIRERQELMKGVGKAAKPVGEIMRGNAEFDAGVVATSLNTWLEASGKLDQLFPAGSESGHDTEAAPAIWQDREGFEAALGEFRTAVEAAVAANPQTLDEAKPVVGPIFGKCKNCHDNYRIEDD